MSKNVFLLSEGTYEKADEEEEEIYEVINVHKLKSATPNLKVVNLYGINFVDDSHIEAFSSNCIQVNFCFIIQRHLFFLCQLYVYFIISFVFACVLNFSTIQIHHKTLQFLDHFKGRLIKTPVPYCKQKYGCLILNCIQKLEHLARILIYLKFGSIQIGEPNLIQSTLN